MGDNIYELHDPLSRELFTTVSSNKYGVWYNYGGRVSGIWPWPVSEKDQQYTLLLWKQQ